jgi:adenylate kinase family enzyme
MKQKKLFVFFVLGGTNVGKTTFLDTVKKAHPEDVHLVQVGKAMREKYGAEYFKGRSWMPETEREVVDMLFSGIEQGETLGRQFIFVDGQPRNPDQADKIQTCRNWPLRERAVIELVCSKEERIRRAKARDLAPEALELSIQRMDRDIVEIHEVFLVFTRYAIHRFNTGTVTYAPNAAFAELMRQYRQDVV